METKKKPSVLIAMPCYDTMKVETCVSLLNTYAVLMKVGITCVFKSVKSSLVTHARNLLTAGFIGSTYDYMLFVDADVEWEPTTVIRMLVPEKQIIVTPYRLKEDPLKVKFPVEFDDPKYIKVVAFDLVELKSAPAGLMLIKRNVFDTLMKKHYDLKIEFPEEVRKKMNIELGVEEDVVDKYMYNFWDTSFKDHEWKGEDIAFCRLVRDAGIKIYANLDSRTTHHGSYGFTGKFGSTLDRLKGRELAKKDKK